MSDEPRPGLGEAKAETAQERIAKGWANLRPQRSGEPGRNPLGLNGREGAEAWRKFLDENDPDDSAKRTRRAVMHDVLYKALKKAKLGALQMGIEQDQGKPPQSIDHRSSDKSMSPYGADSVSSKLRAEIASVTTPSEEATAEAPADDAGK